MSERRRLTQDRRRRRRGRPSPPPVGLAFENLIALLEARGQTVHRLGPGLALTLCPACLAKGRRSLLEIRAVPGGVSLGSCKRGAA
jgi:hypothetical protein